VIGFKDLDKGHWAYGSIMQAVEQGWMGGYPDGTFQPNEKISRAEVASVVSRAVMYMFNAVPTIIEYCKPAVVMITGKTADNKTSMGAGALITPYGHILTNEHVVYDHNDNRRPFTDLTVHVLDNPDGYETTKEYAAHVVATSNWDDLALVKIEGNDFPALQLAETTPVEGTTVIAIGHPNWMQYTSTVGRVTQDRAVLGAFFPRMQTDAAINPGNSGGPIVDLKGRIVAISQAKFSDMDNMGYGVHIEDVRYFLKKHLPELVK
jgi:serine protease Do